MAWVFLEAIPAGQIRLDLWTYSTTGGFYGFCDVLAGFHRLTVVDGAGGQRSQAEFRLLWDAHVVFRRWVAGALVEDAARLEEYYTQQRADTLPAGLTDVLQADPDRVRAWNGATGAIYADLAEFRTDLPLPAMDAAGHFPGFTIDSREEALIALCAFEAAFAQMLLDANRAAAARWMDTIQAHYRVGADAMIADDWTRQYFADFAWSVRAQAQLVPASFVLGAPGVQGLASFIASLRAAGQRLHHAGLIDAAAALAALGG